MDRDPADVLCDLTAKQAQVLDLLLQHKTTKQIARELSIAPNTVDARIAAVRDKWGTTDRKATARVYAHLLETCEKSPCGFSPLDRDLTPDQGLLRELPGSPLFTVADAQSLGYWPVRTESSGILEALDTRFGKIGRVLAASGLALALAATVMLTLAIAEAMSKLI
uniref:helix-turn-helix domain-containing protein n=1 Tax=Altererythrobacter segetis TaxID=1104773 RepID=UPI0014089C54|nr:helix-turn-helix transcriptional regulator [Altererythrobacter segetis]